MDVYLQQFLISAVDGGKWSASRPGRLTRGERGSGTHCIGRGVYPRASLDAVEKRKNFPFLGIGDFVTQPWHSRFPTEIFWLAF
jgi:hypothetical protein